jgi:hypothetical protein
MFKVLFGIIENVVEVADAVVSVPLKVMEAATKPIADGAKAVKEEIEDLLD